MVTVLRFVVALFVAVRCVAGADSTTDLGLKIDEFVGLEMARQKVPGVAVAVLQKGEVVHVKGYGLANVEHQVAVTTATLFQSGSVGKQFTAVLALKLVEEDKLALSDPVSKFFPAAPATWRDITVRHLLTHTSGIPDYGPGFDLQRNVTEAELATYAFGLKLDAAAGARWNYSNTAYMMLGLILQQAGGKPFAEMMRDRIFVPTGMKTARGLISDSDIVPQRAAGYHLRNGALKNQDWVAPTLGTTADGCLYLSLNDVIGWEKAWRDRTLLKPENWALLVTPVRLNSGRTYPYGFGIQIDDTSGRKAERHGGAWQGFTAYRVRYIDDDFSVFVLANLSPANPAGIAEGVARIVEPRLKT
jgi:CubicO group peptidase (beta-lactamase class C family)